MSCEQLNKTARVILQGQDKFSYVESTCFSTLCEGGMTLADFESKTSCPKDRAVFVPLMVNNHWALGVIKENKSVEVWDSAPNRRTRNVIAKKLKGWRITHQKTPRQAENHQCGLFVAMHMVALAWTNFLPTSPPLPERFDAGPLRDFMGSPEIIKKSKQILGIAELSGIPDIMLVSDRKVKEHLEPRMNAYQAQKLREANSGPREEPAQKVPERPKNSGMTMTEEPAPKAPERLTKESLYLGTDQDAREATNKNLCFLYCAILVMNHSILIGKDGREPFSTKVQEVQKLADKLGFERGKMDDMVGALTLLRPGRDVLDIRGLNHASFMDPVDRPSWPLFVYTAPGSPTIPLTMARRTAVAAVIFHGNMVSHRGGEQSAYSGHYEYVTDLKKIPPDHVPMGVLFSTATEEKWAPPPNQWEQPVGEVFEVAGQKGNGSSGHLDRSTKSKNAPVAPKDCPPTIGNLEGHLWEESPRTWYIYPQRPPHIQVWAWENRSKETRAQHVRWLREIKTMPHDLLTLSPSAAAQELIRRMAAARKWKISTIAKNAATLKAALRDLKFYTNVRKGIILDSTFDAFMNYLGKATHQVKPNPPNPITPGKMATICKGIKDPKLRLMADLMWATAGRPNDVLTLTVEDLTAEEEIPSAGEVQVNVAMKRSKAALMAGKPYVVPTCLSKEAFNRWSAHVRLMKPTDRVFPLSERGWFINELRSAIKAVDPTAALPSIRKGAVQHLARQGVPEDQLMRITGHRSLDTLRAYLGFGLVATRDEKSVQGAAKGLLLPESSSSETSSQADENWESETVREWEEIRPYQPHITMSHSRSTSRRQRRCDSEEWAF